MYEAGVSLVLNDQITAKLERMIPLVNQMVKSFERLESILGKAGSLSKANSELNQMAKNMALVDKYGRGLNSVANSISNIGNAAEKSNKKISALGRALAFGGGLAKGAGRAAGGALNFLGNAGLAIFGVEQLASFGQGFAAPGLEYSRLLNQMSMTGWTPDQKSRAVDLANNLRKQYPGIGVNETLRGLIESKSIFSSQEEALNKAPMMAFAEEIIRASKEVAPHLQGHVQQHAGAMVKSAEMLGAINDPKRFKDVIEQMLKASILSGGRVTPEMFQQQIATAGPSRYLWGTDALMLMLTHLNQEMAVSGIGIGARGRAGVEMKTAAQTLMQGTMNKAFAVSLGSLGLLTEPLKKGKGEYALDVPVGQVKDIELLRNNPIAWGEKVLIPALEKRYPGFRTMDAGMQAQAFNTAIKGGPAYTRAFLSELALSGPRATLVRQSEQRSMLPGLETQQSLAQKDPANRLKAINEAWDSMRIKLSQNVIAIQTFNKALSMMLRIMNSLDRMADSFNSFSKRLSSSSNDINRAFGAIGKVIEGFVKSIYQIAKGIPALVGSLSKIVSPTLPMLGGNLPGADFFSKEAAAIKEATGNAIKQFNNMKEAAGTMDHALAVAANRASGHKTTPVPAPTGGGVFNTRRGSAPSGGVTINFNAPVTTQDPKHLANVLGDAMDKRNKQNGIKASYGHDTGAGVGTSPVLTSGFGKH
jgi:hypothetical protein